jgi:hypothetical protein
MCARADLRFVRWDQLREGDRHREPLDAYEAVCKALARRRPIAVDGRTTADLSAPDPSTISVLKVKEFKDRRLVAVSSVDFSGGRLFHIAKVKHGRHGGWVAEEVAGGTTFPARHPQDWVHFEWLSSDSEFNAGGQIVLDAADVAEVRLRTPDGTELCADAQGGVVLLMADRLEHLPSAIDVLDHRGTLLGSQAAFGS